MAQIRKTKTGVHKVSELDQEHEARTELSPFLVDLHSTSICWISQWLHYLFSSSLKYWPWRWHFHVLWLYQITKECSTAKHTKLRLWCTFKESKVERKEITVLISFQIEESQILLAYRLYLYKWPHILWKTRTSEGRERLPCKLLPQSMLWLRLHFSCPVGTWTESMLKWGWIIAIFPVFGGFYLCETILRM